MHTSHIETFERRCLFSAVAVTPAPDVSSHPAAHVVTIKPDGSVGEVMLREVAAALADYSESELTLTRKVSGKQVLNEAGKFFLDMTNLSQVEKTSKAKPAPVTTPSYTLTFTAPDFTLPNEVASVDPTTLAPFPASYTFHLNAKKPLTLFNITQKLDGQVLKFTGTLSKNFQKITGVLTLHRKGNSLAFKYTATPETTVEMV